MKIVNLLKYQLQIYFRGRSIVMPLVITAIFLYAMYSVKPLEIVSSFVVSGVVLFLIMVWIGMAFAQNEKEVEEQILFLRMKNGFQYYLGKLLFLFIMAILFDILYTFFPVVQNALHGFDFFTEKLGIYEIANVFILQLGSACLGGAVGNLFHPRVLHDRKLAIALTVFIVVLGIVTPSMTQHWTILKYVMWIFPPVMLGYDIYGEGTVFLMDKTCQIFLVMLVYTILYAGIKGKICSKHRF